MLQAAGGHGRQWQRCPFLKCCSQWVKVLQKCKRSAARRGKETLITATISSPHPPMPKAATTTTALFSPPPRPKTCSSTSYCPLAVTSSILPFSLGPHLILLLQLPSCTEEIAAAFAAYSTGLALNSDYCAQQTQVTSFYNHLAISVVCFLLDPALEYSGGIHGLAL